MASATARGWVSMGRCPVGSVATTAVHGGVVLRVHVGAGHAAEALDTERHRRTQRRHRLGPVRGPQALLVGGAAVGTEGRDQSFGRQGGRRVRLRIVLAPVPSHLTAAVLHRELVQAVAVLRQVGGHVHQPRHTLGGVLRQLRDDHAGHAVAHHHGGPVRRQGLRHGLHIAGQRERLQRGGIGAVARQVHGGDGVAAGAQLGGHALPDAGIGQGAVHQNDRRRRRRGGARAQ